MKGYGQFCPVAKAAELFCERWTPLILRDLVAGATRFSELQRGVPLMSPTLLTRRLRQLEAEGVIERRLAEDGRTRTYHLTEAGMEFAPLVEALGVWGLRWTRRELLEGEMDLGLLLWAMERSVYPQALSSARSVVSLRFNDLPDGKASWWFLNEGDSCRLCVSDPGFEVDLYLETGLADMIYVIRGDLRVSAAIEEDRLEISGSRDMRDRFEAWLNLGPAAQIESQRKQT